MTTATPPALIIAPRLARRESAGPADAYLLRGAAQLPAALSLPGPRAAQLYRVAGGFLAVLADSTDARLPGAIALRRLAGDLFVPTDADLIPALLPDEAVGLTRDRGIVVLPGGAALAFDPHTPLAPSAWLKLPAAARADWAPLPSPEPLADRLTRVERPPTPVVIETMLGEGEPDGREPLPGRGEPGGPAGAVPDGARPPSAGALDRARAGAGFAAGKLAAWLGALARSPGLAKAGVDLIRRAVERAPLLSEKVLGDQEAALREVLRQLKGGDVEQALKRAPIAVGDPSAPARVDVGSRLGTRDPRYSLRSLLGGGGVASAWLGGGDVWASLAAEYRRLATEAVGRGDTRRAAYLHGVLLRDLRSAAAVLLKGGLFRDAALIYRDKLNDMPAAARAFEQAGDCDEAVRLYVRAGLNVEAGDLLAKLGLADRAAYCYLAAANRLSESGKWVAAGDLLRTKLGDPAAVGTYRRGWDGGGPESAVCGERLLDRHLAAADLVAAADLLAEAEVALAPPRLADAGRFFNHARSVGADFLPPAMRDDLNDRARRVFAAHLRAGGADRNAAGTLFGAWDGAVARDAFYSTRRLPAPDAVADSTQRLTAGSVVAVAVARDSRDIAVATDAAVVLWKPDAGRVLWVSGTGTSRVVGLAVESDGGRVYVLKRDGDDLVLHQFAAAGERFEYRNQYRVPGAAGGAWWLGFAANGTQGVSLDLTGKRLSFGIGLLSTSKDTTESPAVLRTSWQQGLSWEWVPGALRVRGFGSETAREFTLHWTPAVPEGSPLSSPMPDWRRPHRSALEVVGVGANGVLHWGEWDAPMRPDETVRQASLPGLAPFRAACLTGGGCIAAVDARNRVHWLRASAGTLEEVARPTRLDAPATAVALVARPHAGEVVAVLADAAAVRLRVPGG